MRLKKHENDTPSFWMGHASIFHQLLRWISLLPTASKQALRIFFCSFVPGLLSATTTTTAEDVQPPRMLYVIAKPIQASLRQIFLAPRTLLD